MDAKKISSFLAAGSLTIAIAFGSAAAADLSGKVAETMDSGGYTYVLLDTGSGKTWAAMPQTKVAVGDQIKLEEGPVMENFTSKTLNRTFETIVFSPGKIK
ncbi:MAG: hypothetical protein M0017_02945 [Desulfobacteraceae bacterium]|nr:hypothetical protein [Desulfobacteraceae bacterium]